MKKTRFGLFLSTLFLSLAFMLAFNPVPISNDLAPPGQELIHNSDFVPTSVTSPSINFEPGTTAIEYNRIFLSTLEQPNILSVPEVAVTGLDLVDSYKQVLVSSRSAIQWDENHTPHLVWHNTYMTRGPDPILRTVTQNIPGKPPL